jgi:hypothetical protein
MTAPTADRVFDRVPSPPSDSARYSVRRAGIPSGVDTVETHWGLTADFPLDQGSEGACVGFGTSAELSADPIQVKTGDAFAQQLYELAREQDREMGLYFDEGASVLGGLRAARKLGAISGYAWAQNSEQLRDAVLSHGSVVLGTDWVAGMDRLTREFLARVSGPVRGGHCYAIIGYVPRFTYVDPADGKVKTAEAYELINSWGASYGRKGRFYMLRSEVDDLVFNRGGEAAIVTDVEITPAPEPEPSPASPVGLALWIQALRTFIEMVRRRQRGR